MQKARALGAAQVRKLAKKHQSQRCSKQRESSCQAGRARHLKELQSTERKHGSRRRRGGLPAPGLRG